MKTFDFFPRLPPEIRRQIWLLTVPSKPVEIHVQMRDYSTESDDIKEGEKKHEVPGQQLEFYTKPWPALNACHEARRFLERYFIPPTPIDQPVPSWFDWNTSMVICQHRDVFFLNKSRWGEQVLNLTLTDCYYNKFMDAWATRRPVANVFGGFSFSNLEQLLVFPASGHENTDTAINGKTYFAICWHTFMHMFAETSSTYTMRVGHVTVPEQNWLSLDNHCDNTYFSLLGRNSDTEIYDELYEQPRRNGAVHKRMVKHLSLIKVASRPNGDIVWEETKIVKRQL